MTGGEFYRMRSARTMVTDLNDEAADATALSPMHVERMGHTSAVVGHLVFVFGGLNYRSREIPNCECSNALTNV